MTDRDVRAEAKDSAEKKDAAHTEAAKTTNHAAAHHTAPKAEALGKQLESAREKAVKANQDVARLSDQHEHATAAEQLQAMETEHKKGDANLQKQLQPQIAAQRAKVEVLKAKADTHKEA